MEHPDFDDYRWLVGPQAVEWLDKAASAEVASPALVNSLRRQLTPAQTHLVLQQVEQRRRAKAKFDRGDRMFFTPTLLEQASDRITARYKAGRFPADGRVADICCGIGGDLIALAERGPVVGYDRDPVTALLAETNCRALGLSQAEAVALDANDVDLKSFTAWHIDPDRRAEGHRTTQVEAFQPDLPALDRLLSVNENAAIKLAPASEAPEHWHSSAELEWIGTSRECKQQVAWFGCLARHPGQRCATILRGDQPPRTIIGTGNENLATASQIDRYLFEPRAAVLAAGLTAALADQHQLAAISYGIAYLTGPEPIVDAAMATFEVEEVLPLDMKCLRAIMRQRNIGRLEVKKRGVDLDPDQIRRKLTATGNNTATLLLTPHDGNIKAILARRM